MRFISLRLTAFVLASAIASIVSPELTYANFTDVSSGQAYYDAIIYVQAQGIVSGYSDGNYQSR